MASRCTSGCQQFLFDTLQIILHSKRKNIFLGLVAGVTGAGIMSQLRTHMHTTHTSKDPKNSTKSNLLQVGLETWWTQHEVVLIFKRAAVSDTHKKNQTWCAKAFSYVSTEFETSGTWWGWWPKLWKIQLRLKNTWIFLYLWKIVCRDLPESHNTIILYILLCTDCPLNTKQ